MPYSVAADVKSILLISVSTYDTEITDCIASADAFIDKQLEKSNLTVPSVVPQLIADASAYFAAWLFRRRRDHTGAGAFWIEANRLLEAYVGTEEDAAFTVVSD